LCDQLYFEGFAKRAERSFFFSSTSGGPFENRSARAFFFSSISGVDGITAAPAFPNRKARLDRLAAVPSFSGTPNRSLRLAAFAGSDSIVIYKMRRKKAMRLLLDVPKWTQINSNEN